jgi:hypothetical protein
MSGYSILSEFAKRNSLADELIDRYVEKCITISVGIGAAGTIAGLFVPGAGWAAALASLSAKNQAIFTPMVQRIGVIYNAPPELLRDINWDVTLLDGLPTATIAEICGEFGSEILSDLLSEISTELLAELGVNLAGGWIPIIGGLVSAAADFAIAKTVTRHIGVVACAYYQNGGDWLGSKNNTFKSLTDFKGSVDKLRKFSPEIDRNLKDKAEQLVRMMSDANIDRDTIIAALKKQNFPDDIIASVTKHLRRSDK